MIPQDIECIKYLKGFVERNQIPLSSIEHLGWIDGDINKHIQQLELNEKVKSTMRSKMTPQIAQSQAGTQITPASINPPFKGTALRDCTQGELGIEQKEHFGEDFNKDLEFLKKDINTLQNDPKVSHFAEDVKRREAIDTDKIDKDFLEALKGLAADENVKFGERDGLTAPEANIPIVHFNQNESSSKTMITDSVLIPGNGKPA